MALCDGEPPVIYGLGTPDQGAGQWPSWPLGQLVEINSNILPLDLTSLSSFFNFLLKILIHIFLASFLFHYRLVHRTVPSS
jgi:hypothetical protein